MFRGAALLSLDAKSRLAVPTKHREALCTETGGLVLTAHPHRCLLLYPQQAWEPIQSKLMSLSSFDKQSSGLQRLLVGYAEDVELDSAGRLLVSSALRQFANLDKQIMLVGQGNHFELWNVEAWHVQLERAIGSDDMVIPVELEGFSL
ncbi:MAG: division/cell wall cluster transcriptional repressor MraZ [Methylophilaceae bacterium]|nr:division/cell wall cluster transcriptional repressor MraZ [Methylophilaceae bacterium]